MRNSVKREYFLISKFELERIEHIAQNLNEMCKDFKEKIVYLTEEEKQTLIRIRKSKVEQLSHKDKVTLKDLIKKIGIERLERILEL